MAAYSYDSDVTWTKSQQRRMYNMCPLAKTFGLYKFWRQWNNTTEKFEGSIAMEDVTVDSFSIGVQANTAGSGMAITSSNTGAGKVFADDAGASIASSVRGFQSRFLLTVDQTGGSIRALQGQLKLADGVDVTSGIYTAVQGYVELAGDHSAKTGSTFSCFDASLEIASGKTLTIDSGGEACGIHVETTGAGTITNNGVCAGILVSNASGAADWPVGIDLTDSCTTGIDIGACTTGITFSGDATTAINIAAGCTPTTGLLVAGAAAYAIDVTGVATTMAMRAIGQTAPLYQGLTTITLSGASVNAFEINAISSADAAHTLTGLKVYTYPSTAAQATTTIYGIYSEVTSAQNIEAARGIVAYFNCAAAKTIDAESSALLGDVNVDYATTVTAGRLSALHAKVRGDSALTGNLDVVHVDAEMNVDTGIYMNVDSGKTATVGIDLEGSGTYTAGIKFGTTTTTVLNIQHVGTTSSHVIDMIDAYTGMFIETGSYSSSASKGITLTTDNSRPVSFLFDDGGAILGSTTLGNYRAVLSRVYLASTQTGQVSIRAIRGQVKAADSLALNIGTNEFGSINAVEGYIELAGATGRTVGANTRIAALHALTEIRQTVTLTTGGLVVGVLSELAQATGKSVSGVGSAGMMIDRVDSDHTDVQVVWDTGLNIAGSSCTAGIVIGACAGHGVNVSGTFTTASSRSYKSDMTINNPNYGDGYSANEFQLNITGTAAGHISAGGMWVNINSGTHNDSNFICAQTNGIYQAAGTITGKIVIFGMRMAHQCTNNGSTYFYPFSIVSAGGLNDTTALFHCNAAAINMGAVTDAGSDDGVLVPLFQEGAGGNIGYVKIYSLS